MDILKQLEDILQEAKDNSEHWLKGVPSPMMKMDIAINRIMAEFILLSKEDQKILVKELSNELAWLLLDFSINMATYSLRFSDQKIFTNGLTALGMAFEVLDHREILLVLSLYYNASKKGLSFESTLHQENAYAVLVHDFINRSEEDKTLESMGYSIMMDENKAPYYKRTW
jgi:hypothetical protein